MRAIWKYPVPIDDLVHRHSVPTGAIVRHVAQQGVAPCMWIEVQPDLPRNERRYRVFGAGHVIPDGFVYVGTAMDGPFVWHIYEQQ